MRRAKAKREPSETKTIRGGSGLGDALYLQAVCRYLLSKGVKLKASTNYPELFCGLDLELDTFKKGGIDILAHYSLRRAVLGASQFRDCCIQAGITETVDLKLDWVPGFSKYLDLKKHGKPIVVIGLPRSPMARDDGLGMELLPRMKVYQSLIDKAKSQGFLVVQVGSGVALHKLQGIDVDLSNSTTVTELIDVVAISDAVICYPSFLVPLAESLGKRFMVLFSEAGLKSHKIFLRHITPSKVIHRHDLGSYVIDNQTEEIDELHLFR